MPRKARPAQVASGQPYGARKEQEAVLASIPAPAPGPTAPAAAPDPLTAAQNFQMPALTPLGAPTTRPGEPVTAGLDIGAGPGSEALGQFGPNRPPQDVLNLLKSLPTFELMAGMPGGSIASRNLVKRLRSMIPMPGTPQSADPRAALPAPNTTNAAMSTSTQPPNMPQTTSTPSPMPTQPATSSTRMPGV